MEHNILYAYFLLPAPKLRATNILYKVTLGYYGGRRREITIQKTTDLSSAGVSKLVLLAIEMASSTSSYSHPLLGSPHTAPAHSSPAPYPLSFLTSPIPHICTSCGRSWVTAAVVIGKEAQTAQSHVALKLWQNPKKLVSLNCLCENSL